MSEEWLKKRTVEVIGLRQDKYLVKIPDVLTLIDDWIKLGVNMESKELGNSVVKPEVIKGILEKYMIEPKFFNELLQDQADVVLIYKAIISEWTGNPNKIAEFFRKVFPSIDASNGVKSNVP